jgi:hypothetical protein
MDNIGYGHQIVKIAVFSPADNEKYSLHDLNLRYKRHEGNMSVKYLG